ncbi:MAG: Molybdopterin-synthase adenylyltransferase MoeB [Chloroflexi bacterium]|nr:Molybdopterin-synthase adenylyltransferase MoeB [Chloroflexota bacterium]
MTKSYADLLREAKASIQEVSVADAERLRLEGVTFLDVREGAEWDQGYIPGALLISRSYLELHIEATVADHDAPIVLYCAGGVRSAFAAQTLQQLGYTNPISMAGGFQSWKAAGLPWTVPVILTKAQQQRYSRHLLIPEVGMKGQTRLLESKALLVGAGGLGSPAALYLAAAGVGTIGIVDFDVVDVSNLQRQILHTTDRVGEKKVESARKSIQALNPDINVVPHEEMLVADNVERIIAGYDVILDGTDTFETRYHPVRGAVLSLPLPDPAAARARARLLRGRGPGCRARDHGSSPGQRGPQGPAGSRDDARRTAATVRRPRGGVHRTDPAPGSNLPGLLGRCPRGARAWRGPGSLGIPHRRSVRPRRHGLWWLHRHHSRGTRMSTVFIPTVLRPSVGGVKSLELGGGTVGEVVTALLERHPGLGGQLLTPEGDLNRFVNVYVNGQDVRYLDGLATPVTDRDEVRLLPAMAGG